jgi:hypothetical protein
MHPLTLQTTRRRPRQRHDRSGRRLTAGTSGPPHAAIPNVQAKSSSQQLRLRLLAWGAAGHSSPSAASAGTPARIAAADRSAGSCRLRRAIRNPAPEVRHVPTPAPMPAG